MTRRRGEADQRRLRLRGELVRSGRRYFRDPLGSSAPPCSRAARRRFACRGVSRGGAVSPLHCPPAGPGGAPPQHRRAAAVAPRRPRAYAPIGARVLRGAGAYDLAIRGV